MCPYYSRLVFLDFKKADFLGEKLTGSQFDDLIDGMESSNGQIVIEDFIKKVDEAVVQRCKFAGRFSPTAIGGRSAGDSPNPLVLSLRFAFAFLRGDFRSANFFAEVFAEFFFAEFSPQSDPSMIEKNHPLMIPRRCRGYTGGF